MFRIRKRPAGCNVGASASEGGNEHTVSLGGAASASADSGSAATPSLVDPALAFAGSGSSARRGSKRQKAVAKASFDAEERDLAKLQDSGTNPWAELPDQPDWAGHVYSLLEDELSNCPRDLPINVWSDCAGLDTEMNAGKRIAKTLKEKLGVTVTFKLYQACEQKEPMRDFIMKSYAPPHLSADVLERDFSTGAYNCLVVKAKSYMPSSGIDIYTAGFPCSPWSGIGLRKG